MGIVSYYQKYKEFVSSINNGKPSKGILVKYAIKGVADYIVYGSTITDFFELSFYRKSNKEKRKYVTWRFHKRFIYNVDKPSSIKQYAVKDFMYQQLKTYVNRKQLYLDNCSYEDYKAFYTSVPQFLFKPNDGSCGDGIELIDRNNSDLNEYYSRIKEAKGTLDECIVQHHLLSELNPASVNTVRIFTFRICNTIYYILYRCRTTYRKRQFYR